MSNLNPKLFLTSLCTLGVMAALAAMPKSKAIPDAENLAVELLVQTPATSFESRIIWDSLREHTLTGPPVQETPRLRRFPQEQIASDILMMSHQAFRQTLSEMPRLPHSHWTVRPNDNRLILLWDPQSEIVEFRPAFGKRNAWGNMALRVIERIWPETDRHKIPPQKSFFFLTEVGLPGTEPFEWKPKGIGFGEIHDTGRLLFVPFGNPKTGGKFSTEAILTIGRDAEDRIWIWFEEP